MNQGISFLKLAAIGLFVLLLITGGVFLLLRKRSTSSPPPAPEETSTEETSSETSSESSSTSSVPTGETVLQHKSEVQNQYTDFENQAFRKAREWKSDASLCAVTIKILSNLHPQTLTFSYVYCSAKDKRYYFNANFDAQGQFLRALIWRSDYFSSNLIPFTRKFIKLSFVDALELVEQNGGQSFRQNHPHAIITLSLYRSGAKFYHYWTVKYEDPFSPERLVKKIDAYTKEFVGTEE